MINSNEFPNNVFPDIKNESTDFPKYTKERVSEDFFSENFQKRGWQVFTPLSDTGIDMIISKSIKDENGNEQEITRFVQIKTRSLKLNKSKSSNDEYILGYTLCAKDFRDDPRGVVILFNDDPSINGKYNAFIIPMHEYFKFFYENSTFGNKNQKYGDSHFSTPSFRKENNKINSIKYNKTNDNWKYNSDESFMKFLGIDGYNLIDSLNIEKHYDEYKNEINSFKNKLYFNIHSSNGKKKAEDGYLDELHRTFKVNLDEDDNERKKKFKFTDDYVKNTFPKDIYESYIKYTETERSE